MKKSIIDEQTYSTLQKYFMSPDSKELLMMELGMIRETKEKREKLEYKTSTIEIEEAELVIRSIGDGIAKLNKETILTIEFTHTRKGRRKFSTPMVAKYSLLQSKVRPVLRTVKQKHGHSGSIF